MGHDNAFGQLVRQRRRTLDLTQEELARRVGCAAVTLRKIEAGDLRPSQQVAERLAMALAIPLDERADFVRQARAVQPGGKPIEPTPTPQVMPEEIGAEDLSGRAIRGYQLGEKIGAGAFGAVYRAVQPLVEREVAVKIILPQYANHPDFIRRFEAEAQLVARLEHPHIVPLYDYWREPGVAYLVMRLLRGGNVHQLLEHGPLALDSVARLMEQITGALHTAHRAGVVHRDLKPSNVLLDEEQNAYLADFGIAKNLGNPNLDEQTQAGMLIGSPAYMSPEQINEEPIRPQADIYSLGVMLYELLTGARPFLGPTPLELIQQHLYTPLPPLASNKPGLPAAFDDVIARATNKDPLQRYPEVDLLLADFKQVINTGRLTASTIELAAPQIPPCGEIVNPYKGLRPFEEADAPDFFGREALTQQLLARLGEGGDLARFLAVIGPSGSGKSSVVGAGLVPALRRGGLPHSENWFIVEVLPGPHPLEELEAALLRVAVNPPESLLAQIKEDRRGLLRAVNRCLPAGDDVELVLVLDQFEEVFTLVADEAERAHLLDSLVEAVVSERSRVRVLVTLRADFIDKPLRYVDFGELLKNRSELVLPLTPDEMEAAIGLPAERAGLQIEPGLLEAIIADVTDQPGALPLLQYALTELVETLQAVETLHATSLRQLTRTAYQAIGGVRGALGRRAEDVYQALDAAQQATARQIFLRLVTLGEGTEDVRRRVLRVEIESLSTKEHDESLSDLRGSNEFAAVLDAFGCARLLTFDRDLQTRGSTVEVAHEALLREWPRLREWLNDSRADVRQQRLLAAATVEWLNAQRDASYLLQGARLAQFEGWAQTTSLALTHDERDFLEASVEERKAREAAEAERQRRELIAAQKLAETESARAAAERQRAEEQTRAANRLRTRNRVIIGAGLVALLLAVLAGLFGVQANSNAQQAQSNLQNAQTAEARAVGEAQVRATAQADAVSEAQVRATAQADAVSEAQARTTQQAVAEANFKRAEAQRLAGEANSLILSDGNIEQAALLSLRSMNLQYTPQGDIALTLASRQNLPKRVISWKEYGGAPRDVAFSPDGRYVLIGEFGDCGSELWDIQTGLSVRQFGMNLGETDSVAFSPDGRLMLTGHAGGTVALWSFASGELLRSFKGAASVDKVIFFPDGKTIIAVFVDGQISQWDVQTGDLLRQFTAYEVGSDALSPDGHYFATATVGSPARLWDLQSGQMVREFGEEIGSSGVAFSPDGKLLVVGSWGTMPHVWDVQTGQEVHALTGHTLSVGAVVFSPDGRYILTGSEDRTARLWDAQSGKTLQIIHGHTDKVTDVAFSPDGKSFVTISNDFSARIWDIDLKTTPPELLGHTASLNDAAFSSDGKYILTSSNDHTARLWDAHTGQPLHTLAGHEGYVAGVTFSPDSQYALTTDVNLSGIVRLWSVNTGEEVRRFIPPDNFWPAMDVVVSPDGKYVLAGYAGAIAVKWELSTGKLLDKLKGHDSPVAAVAISRDGKYALTGSWDTFAILWTFPQAQEVLRTLGLDFAGHVGGIKDAVFSPDGKSMLTGGFDALAILWDAQTGQLIRRFVGHTSGVNSVDISSDGKLVATGSTDGTARIWDFETGEEVRRFDMHASVSTARFSPNGKYLLIGDSTGVARLWDMDYHDTMRYLCSRLLRDFTDDERKQYGITDATLTCPK